MIEAGGTTTPRRVLVALDTGEGTAELLETAAGLAADLGAELVGLFVEDTELVEAAGLPVTRSISGPARAAGQIDARMMRRALRISADRAGQALAAAAERRQVKWSFRVIEGRIEEQVLAEVRRDDLLALGSPARIVRRTQIAVASRTVAERAPCSVLLMQAPGGLDRPVTVVYDGSERALALGARLARHDRRPLFVLALAETEAAGQELEGRARDWLEAHGLRGRVRARVIESAEEICAAVSSEHAGTLVLDPEGDLVRRLGLEGVLGGLKCTVLVLR